MKKVFIAIMTFVASAASAQQQYTLEQLIDSAHQNNIAMRNARHNIDAAHHQRSAAFTNYFPSVSANGAWFKSDKDLVQTTVNPSDYISPEMGAALAQSMPAEALAGLANPMDISMINGGVVAGVMATQPIFAGGQIVNGNRLAKIGEEVSSLQLELSENEVEKTTETYFWQLISLQEKMKTVDAVNVMLADIYKDVEVAVKAGLTMRNDLLQVQLRQNDVKSQQLKLQNAFSLMKMLTAHYCGLTDTSFSVIVPAMTNEPLQALASGDINSLPEYQLLQKQTEAANLQRKMEVGKNLPTVAVGAGYNYHTLMSEKQSFGMVFATVSIPITDWWSGSHNIKRKKIAQQQAEEQFADNVDLLRIRQHKALNDVIEAAQQVDIAHQSIAQAEENLRIQRDCYRAGTLRMSNLLEAQLLYQQTLDKYVDAQAEYQNRLLEYKQAGGR